MNESQVAAIALNTLTGERDGLTALINNFQSGPLFKAVQYIKNSKKIVFSGVGKSGDICRKVDESAVSMGIASAYMDASNAFHGGFGRITFGEDVVVIVSNSGKTTEAVNVARICQKRETSVIGVTNNPNSPLAKLSTVVLNTFCTKETGCIDGLAPTTSTTVTLALLDALLMATKAYLGLTREHFKINHPGGDLGIKTANIGDMMVEAPIVEEDMSMSEASGIISKAGLGCAAVINKNGFLCGFVTDGDISRLVTKATKEKDVSILTDNVQSFMSKNPHTTTKDRPIKEVRELMRELDVGDIVVIDDDNKVLGLADRKDLDRRLGII